MELVHSISLLLSVIWNERKVGVNERNINAKRMKAIKIGEKVNNEMTIKVNSQSYEINLVFKNQINP